MLPARIRELLRSEPARARLLSSGLASYLNRRLSVATVARVATVPQSMASVAHVMGFHWQPSGQRATISVAHINGASSMRQKRHCGATTRRGTPCQCKATKTKRGAWRCRLHGGLSTGPKTAEDRQRIAEALRARWAALRATLAEYQGVANCSPAPGDA